VKLVYGIVLGCLLCAAIVLAIPDHSGDLELKSVELDVARQGDKLDNLGKQLEDQRRDLEGVHAWILASDQQAIKDGTAVKVENLTWTMRACIGAIIGSGVAFLFNIRSHRKVLDAVNGFASKAMDTRQREGEEIGRRKGRAEERADRHTEGSDQ